MEYLVTASQMKECDRITIEKYGMPAMVLMERAALACVEYILEREAKLHAEGGIAHYRKTLVVAGCGNNGGDGFAIGRLLKQKGFPVDFVLIGNEEKCSAETAQQIRILRSYGCRIEQEIPNERYDYIIDAIFGIGLKSEVRESHRKAIEYINQQDAYVLSVDIPSGINADTGAVCGCAVQADITVTFAFQKVGLFMYPGARYAGNVICRDIGITEDSLQQSDRKIFTFSGNPSGLLPYRREDGNKGTFGKVALYAGSKGMAGAAVLSASAVLHAGAGMVRVVSEEGNRVVLQSALPEAMFGSYKDFFSAYMWADIIAAGPGMGTGKEAEQMLTDIIRMGDRPLVLDADAVNLLSEKPELLELLKELQKDPVTRRPLILTPHPGELARLEGIGVKEILQDPFAVAGKWAEALHAAVLCKGARTVVAAPDGSYYVNRSGNSGMATAGSGDVLTGIIAALLAQGQDAFMAAVSGVYLHGCAGDSAAHKKNEYSLTAQDLVSELDVLM